MRVVMVDVQAGAGDGPADVADKPRGDGPATVADLAVPPA